MIDYENGVMQIYLNGKIVCRRVDHVDTAKGVCIPVLFENEAIDWTLGSDIPIVFKTF